MTDFKSIIAFRSPVTTEQNETINKSILFHGKQRQLLCFAEELAELIQAMRNDNITDGPCKPETLSEIADVVVAVEDIKILYQFHNSQFNIEVPRQLLIEAIPDMLIGISHFERNRITETDYKGIIIRLYMSIEEYLDIRQYQDEFIWDKMNELIDKKFEKFKSQIDEEMKNVRED